MPLQQTTGNVTTDAYAGGVAAIPKYIEDYFSTWLYVGNGASRTITNNIDLATKGGMVWSKDRSAAQLAFIQDTARTGTNSALCPSLTGGGGYSNAIDSYTTSGYVISGTGNGPTINPNGDSCVSWSFAKAPKFFDVVTFTVGSSTNQRISHSLGSVPGCIIVKATSGASSWLVYHQSIGRNVALQLNSTGTGIASTDIWGTSNPTSTDFGLDDTNTFAAGTVCVAYLFANNAGGFGLTGTDNVISCGSFTASGAAASVTLGYEPQFVLYKCASATGGWEIADNMRGMPVPPSGGARLFANTSAAEQNPSGNTPNITSTGFYWDGNFSNTSPASGTFIYIAIRRGPMKVPTSGTSVFAPVAQTGGGTVTTNFPVDLAIPTYRNISYNRLVMDRLRGGTTNTYTYLLAEDTGAETSGTGYGLGFDYNTSIYDQGVVNSSSYNAVYWNFRRAPSFFDEVCYTGTGTTGTTFAHNLGVVPEMMIVKRRASGTANWGVYHKDVGNTKALFLNLTNTPSTNYGYWNNTTPTSSVFTVGNITETNASGSTYVAYLFATCAGVSKVGSYTGNGSTQTINCGFTGGARFVLIKRTDAAGDWYVYDTARGMTTLTDPYLLLNSTAAESATLGSVTTVSTGFALNASILAAINTNAASYIFFAVA